MARTILLGLILLLTALWLSAQQTSKMGTDTGPTIIKGCLKESNGNYLLIDKSGNTYELTGDTAQLSHHVGHEMQVTGTMSSAEGTSSGSTMSSSSSSMGAGNGGTQTIQVQSFKHISTSCTAGQ